MQQMTLLRKYPPKRRFQRMWQRLAGAKIMAGNKKNKKFKALYKFTEGSEEVYLHEIRFPNDSSSVDKTDRLEDICDATGHNFFKDCADWWETKQAAKKRNTNK